MYSPVEAAWYMQAKQQKINRWVFGTSASRPVFEPQLGRIVDTKIVTFLDFAQALSIHDIRLNIGIPLSRIRDAYRCAQEEYDVEFPFASKHGIFVFGNLRDPKNCQLGIYLPEKDEREESKFIERKCVQLTGSAKRNRLIHEVVSEFSKRLSYENNLATEYRAFESGGHSIIMRPGMYFGKPHLPDVGHRAETLYDAVQSEGSVKEAARIYDVPQSAVRASLKYFEKLKTLPEQIEPGKIRD